MQGGISHPSPAEISEPSALRMHGGRVIDPSSGVDAVRDVLVHGGRIVERLPAGVACQTIDASGRLVMPGAIDVHTHVASRGVAIAHELCPASVPAPEQAALDYLRMGYTSVVDPAVPPADVAFAQAMLDRMPRLDTGFLLELGSDDELLRLLEHHGDAAAIELIDRLVADSGALGLKLVGHRHPAGLDAPINGTRITPRMLIRFAAEAVEALPAPCPLQLHVPDLGGANAIDSTLAALDALAGRAAHLAHAQFYAYRQDDRGRLCSAAATLCDYMADHENITFDTGCIAFGPACMVTRDHLLGEHLAALMRTSLTRRDGWSVMPMHYAPDNAVNAVQWATGLELILRSADLSRVAMSVDHPNGGPFTAIPGLLALLANREARLAALREVHSAATQRTGLGELTRELSDGELVILTRTATARAMGLSDRGHLRPGAMADLTIADRPWQPPQVVIKSGRVVVRDGELVPIGSPRPPGAQLKAHDRSRQDR